MAQSFEYPMWSPHPKAKLFKRYTAGMAALRTDKIAVKDKEIFNSDIIIVQGNRYVCIGTFRWVEETTKQDTDEQPLDGLIVPNSYLTIKTNSLKKFGTGDIVDLPKDTHFGGLWTITDGISVDMIYTPKTVQTFQYLPLLSVG